MTMLSSVAERLYWMARYLERAESTARLSNAYSNFVLDIPVGFEPGWPSLIDIIDGNEAFERRYKNYTEHNVLKFLTADTDSPGSVRYSINAARENGRTVRDCMPESYWELINELNILVNEHAADAIARRSRSRFLDNIVARVQRLTGLIDSSMTRDQAYRFMRVGKLIECADMTSRVLDIAVATTARFEEEDAAAIGWLWVNLLRSLSALSAYRREVGPMIDRGDIVDFVFNSKSFARSISYCLNSIDEEIEGLANPQKVWSVARKTRAVLSTFDTDDFSLHALHECIDELQLKLIELNGEIYDTWFYQ